MLNCVKINRENIVKNLNTTSGKSGAMAGGGHRLSSLCRRLRHRRVLSAFAHRREAIPECKEK